MFIVSRKSWKPLLSMKGFLLFLIYVVTTTQSFTYLLWPSSASATRRLSLKSSSLGISLISSTDQEEEAVQVFDNVFSAEACKMLHYLAVEHNERTHDGSSLFTRPPDNQRPLTPIECAIDSALTEMGDTTSRKVEYWSRKEYMNIDVHADIDEDMLEDEGVVRCPTMGHVFYLSVKDDIRGPTCIFPYNQGGWWGLDRKKKEHSNDGTKMVTVPAVSGRIVRFNGSAMHGVPKPANRWLLSDEQERKLRNEEDQEHYETGYSSDEEWDTYYDDDDDDDDEVERSVLLFNTWPDDEPGPKGVTGDIAIGAVPEGIELSKEDIDAYMKFQEEQIFADWEEIYGKNGEEVRCNPASEWNYTVVVESKQTASIEEDDNKKRSLNVPLMGMERRRMYSKNAVQLFCEIEAMELVDQALNEKYQPTSFILAENSQAY